MRTSLGHQAKEKLGAGLNGALAQILCINLGPLKVKGTNMVP